MRPRYLLAPLAVLVLAACSGNGAGPTEPAAAVTSTTPPTPPTPPLQAAAEQCEIPESAVGDDGATLNLDGAGKDDKSLRDGGFVTDPGKLEFEDMWCVMGEIDAPDAVYHMMEGTRALDGRQTHTTDGYTYMWSYHPDAGLDILITEAE